MERSAETDISVQKRGDLYEILVAGPDSEKIVQSIVAGIGTAIGSGESTILDFKIRTTRNCSRATL